MSSGVNPAQITPQQLIRLSRYSLGLDLKPGQIRAIQSGDYQSRFRGRGMEYDESRLYQPGDDIRNIDWRVTARSGRVHTKLFREERERPVFIGVDFRQSMFFATRGCFKAVMASKLASLLAWTANRQSDRVGGFVFTENEFHEHKPVRGKRGVLQLINEYCQNPAWKKYTDRSEQSSLEPALARLHHLVKPGSQVFLISDFRQYNNPARSHLLNLARHNDVILLMVYDRLETELPPPGEYRVSFAGREFAIDTSNDRSRAEYRTRFNTCLNELKQLSRSGKINFIHCSTEDDPVMVLQQGLSK